MAKDQQQQQQRDPVALASSPRNNSDNNLEELFSKIKRKLSAPFVNMEQYVARSVTSAARATRQKQIEHRTTRHKRHSVNGDLTPQYPQYERIELAHFDNGFPTKNARVVEPKTDQQKKYTFKLGHGHDFHLTPITNPAFCDYCRDPIWGITKKCLRCANCHYTCHHRCRHLVMLDCEGAAADSPLPTMAPPPEYRPLVAVPLQYHHPETTNSVDLGLRTPSSAADDIVHHQPPPLSASSPAASPTRASPTSAGTIRATPTRDSPTRASPTSASTIRATPTSASPTRATPTSPSPTRTSPTSASPTRDSPLQQVTGLIAAGSSATMPHVSPPHVSPPHGLAPYASLPHAASPSGTSQYSTSPYATAPLRQRLDSYNKVQNTTSTLLLMTDADTFQGFIRVTLNLTRPINMYVGARPPSIYQILSHEDVDVRLPPYDAVDGQFDTMSFYIPKNTIKSLHISSKTTTSEVISELLHKFKITDSPRKFALYEQITDQETKHVRVVRKVCEVEYPLSLWLAWQENQQYTRSFVLQENETGDIMWEAFSVPELDNFLRMLKREEEEHVEQIRTKYKLLKLQLSVKMRHATNTETCHETSA